MKKIILIAFLWLSSFVATQAQNSYYWTSGQKHELQPDSSQWIIFFDNQIVNTNALSLLFKQQYAALGNIEERPSWGGVNAC